MTENDYLPYKAINVYMERDYLEKVLGDILERVPTLPKDEQYPFYGLFRKYAKVLGFRNPVRAPMPLQIKAYMSAFEKLDEVIPFTLTTWTKINQEFAEKVRDWLKSAGWEELALERTFNESEGFVQKWPGDFSFEELDEKFKQAHPDLSYSRDDLILLVLWITGCLPGEQS